MRLLGYLAAGVGVSCLLAGCQQRQSSADLTVLGQVREAYIQVDRDAQVGIVTATLPERGLVSVEQVDLDQFEEGDVLVLMDSKQRIIGAGHVVRKTDKALHLSYDVTASGRQVEVGDLAVRSRK